MTHIKAFIRRADVGYIQTASSYMYYCIAGRFGKLTRFEHLAKESLAN